MYIYVYIYICIGGLHEFYWNFDAERWNRWENTRKQNQSVDIIKLGGKCDRQIPSLKLVCINVGLGHHFFLIWTSLCFCRLGIIQHKSMLHVGGYFEDGKNAWHACGMKICQQECRFPKSRHRNTSHSVWLWLLLYMGQINYHSQIRLFYGQPGVNAGTFLMEHMP